MFSFALLLSLAADARPKVYTAVRIDLEGKTGLCPGEGQKLDLLATEDGKERKIKSGAWKEFQISWDVGPVSPKGALEMPANPRASWGRAGALSVRLAADPAVSARATLPVRYDCPQLVAGLGVIGPTGERGGSGSTGADADGGDGQDGADGGDGGNGPDLEVQVTLVKEPAQGIDVLQVAVKNVSDGSVVERAIAVQGGQLTISADGGSGGLGGPGGGGGSGATGRGGGDGGDGGDGGNGGTGGEIRMIVDPSAMGKTGGIALVSGAGLPGGAGLAGDGGQAFDPGLPGAPGHAGHAGRAGLPGPAPEVKSATVAPLW